MGQASLSLCKIKILVLKLLKMAGRTEGSAALQDEGPDIVMTPGGASGEGSSTPNSLGYRNIMQSVNNDMRPDFTGQAMTPDGETPEQRR